MFPSHAKQLSYSLKQNNLDSAKFAKKKMINLSSKYFKADFVRYEHIFVHFESECVLFEESYLKLFEQTELFIF